MPDSRWTLFVSYARSMTEQSGLLRVFGDLFLEYLPEYGMNGLVHHSQTNRNRFEIPARRSLLSPFVWNSQQKQGDSVPQICRLSVQSLLKAGLLPSKSFNFYRLQKKKDYTIVGIRLRRPAMEQPSAPETGYCRTHRRGSGLVVREGDGLVFYGLRVRELHLSLHHRDV
ncbi:MAG: hypothetical protein METHP_01600 [Methanoregula sp. SKADARSKE-2]|nr:MAG: hypothetical protein METHP_01600 [Methanoregula sp. SKADARSKE-2]